MSRKSYTPIPTQGDIPDFIKKAYLADHIRNLIAWSINEYEAGMNYLSKHASPRTILFFQREVSPMRVLAECDEFWEVLKYINETNFNALTARERSFVRKAHELFRALS